MPKIGMIFECGPMGADKQVVEYLAKQIRQYLVIKSRTLSNKPNVITEGASVAQELLKDGCQKVFIIWDLFPNWRNDEKPCRHADRTTLLNAIQQLGVADGQVILLCITEELEAWLLADGRAVSAFLSRETRKVKIDDEKRPDLVANPKGRLTKYFKEHRGIPYEDRTHAIKIVQLLPDLKRIGKSESFKRFQEKLQTALD